MRKILLLVVIAAVAVAYGVAASTLRARVAAAAPRIARELEQKLDVRVELGDIVASYAPLGVRIEGIRVASGPATTPPFLTIAALDVRARLLSLLQGRLDAGEIVADGPRVELINSPHDKSQETLVSDRLLALLAEIPFAVTVHDGDVVYEDRDDNPPSKLVASAIAGTIRGAVDGALEAKLAGAALGERSKAALTLRLKPKVGPTGGDEVALEFDVDGGSAAALPAGFVMLRGAELHDPLQLSLRRTAWRARSPPRRSLRSRSSASSPVRSVS
jgi:hypothetical protein